MVKGFFVQLDELYSFAGSLPVVLKYPIYARYTYIYIFSCIYNENIQISRVTRCRVVR